MRALISRLLLGTGFCFAALQLSLALPSQPAARLQLAKGWAIRSSCETQSKGDAISAPVFHVEHWLATRVPSTVLAAQVSAGLFKDPFFGTNLLSIPGMDYPVGKIYANLPVTAGSPYRCSWWYRTEFDIPAVWKRSVWLHFNGINYRGNLWVNGKQVATDAQIRGAYRTYDFEITKYAQRGKRNAVAVETFIQTENGLGINYVDWNPAPADKSLGLWRDVYLGETGAVTLRNPTVNTHFADDQLSAAELTVIADLENHSDRALKAAVHGSIGAINFQQVVELAPAEKKIVRFRSEEFPQLRITRPPVWWPYQYGKPELQELKLAVTTGGPISDAKSIRFGIREVEGKLNDKGYLQFRINRRNILIRGAGWAPDMFYREPKERIAQEFRYVRDMNLNTIRLEGKLGSEDMFDLADQMGILIMAGWCCCDHWEHWENWTAADHEIANASLYSQISRLRAHPSVFVWLNGSDNPPPPDVESSYINILKERDWANPFISSASAKPSTLTGPSGVKMSGPYDYVPPEYWYLDKQKFGGAYGFNTETSPGPAIPSSADIRRTLPESSWWPMDDVWNYHAGLASFAQYNIFNQAMDASFGPARSLDEYTRKAQLMSYDGERAMFEAYSGSKYTSTGVIQWMLNNAWPSFIWHLYDYYLVPGGGYFGAKKANELLHILYRYDDRTVAVVNSAMKSHDGLIASARLFDLNGKQVFYQRAPLSLGPDAVVSLFSIPAQKGTLFLKLE
ncbi:MAG TPA: beta galactosidase jelly roll domain-containing protein, partial [Terriglobales bacterium]|nr:beta galactosidase jelly roll domain-containing protein [Terriglobales bacterium]